jgi:SAM-dependent methyltransferase
MFQRPHAVLPEASHDEFAREEFCGTLRQFFAERLWPGNAEVYSGIQLPAFEARFGRQPASRQEVKDLMEETFYYRASGLIGRCAQELLWDTVGESVERQIEILRDRARPPEHPIGSLKLHPEMPIPRYVQSVDIHAMPGNFHTELCADDVFAGALYDRGVYYFAYGGMGPDNEIVGTAMADYLKQQFPDLRPKRILDVGCGVGFSTLPWKRLFPDADVYGVDIAAPMVRYAHARAESWGMPVHFSQQDGTRTDFPDGFFDIVSSCLLNHECPVHVVKGLIKEGARILAAGGVYLCDGLPKDNLSPERQLLGDWYTYNVNEPFTSGLNRIDYEAVFAEAGFDRAGFFLSGSRPPAYLKGMYSAQNNGSGTGYVGNVKIQSGDMK